MTKNLPNFVNAINSPIQAAQQSPSRIKTKENHTKGILDHITEDNFMKRKMSRTGRKILRTDRHTLLTEEKKIAMPACFSSETF